MFEKEFLFLPQQSVVPSDSLGKSVSLCHHVNHEVIWPNTMLSVCLQSMVSYLNWSILRGMRMLLFVLFFPHSTVYFSLAFVFSADY